jgi:hypothetical protein
VHSKEQIRASSDSGGRSLSQHSHPGLSSSIELSLYTGSNPGGDVRDPVAMIELYLLRLLT